MGPYQVCKGWFALCTIATCGSKLTGPNTYTCTQCYVLNGLSVASTSTQPACMTVTSTPQAGDKLQSRFAVMKGVDIVQCSISHSWANCLNATCTVNSSDTKKATCTCSQEPSSPYVSGSGNNGCSGDPVISSESQTAATLIGNFWNDEHLTPFPPPQPPAKK